MPRAAKPSAARRLRLCDDDCPFRNPRSMRDEARGEQVRRIDLVEMVQIPADDSCAQARANELRQKNIRQADETKSGEQLAANFDAGLAKFLNPAGERGMRNPEVLRELLARDRDHHV